MPTRPGAFCLAKMKDFGQKMALSTEFSSEFGAYERACNWTFLSTIQMFAVGRLEAKT